MKVFLLLFVSVISYYSNAQLKELNPSVYNDWKHIENHQISNDGNFVSFEINPHQGDGYLYIYSVKNAKLDSIPRASNASFSGESDYIAFKITPGYDTLRTCELKKVDKKSWPKDSLGIYIMKNDSLIKFSDVTSFSVNDASNWMTFMSGGNKMDQKGEKKKKKWFKCKKDEAPSFTSKGHLLTLFDPISNQKNQFENIQSHELSKKGNLVVFSSQRTFDKVDSIQLHYFSTAHKTTLSIGKASHSIPTFSVDEEESMVTFLSSGDTSKVKHYSLQLFELGTGKLQVIADTSSTSIPATDGVSENYAPRFTKGGKIIYFGVAERPKEAPKDTLIESEKVKLDLWHHADKRLQPQQLLELKRDERKTDLYVYRISEGKIIQLGDDTLSIYTPKQLAWNQNQGVDHYFLGVSTEPYAHTYNWDTPNLEDYYIVSATTGERKLIKRAAEFGVNLSPSGASAVYFDSESDNYYSIDTKTFEETCITCTIDNVSWVGDINGMPMKAYPLGVIGWKKGEDRIYLQSEFDIWEYEFSSGKVASITSEEGSLRNIELRPRAWSNDSVYIDFENYYVQGFNRTTKSTHFYSIKDHGSHTDLLEGTSYNAEVYGLVRSKDKSQIIGRKMTFIDYPEVYLADTDFTLTKRLSHTNPQQSEYEWGTVELVKWTSYDGIDLEGLLYKPTSFDASKQYPLMVYFYELYSDRFHQHYIPKPTASIVFPTEYASAGYVVFIPDVRYRPGHPAQSAYDCILSGTDKVLALYPNIDSTRMALQGQSWGGYQTAQLVTMTNRYKAAMAGAPVTNMFSAYGGIRWGSGLNRQFQYEKTQSRIGYTIWERPDLYVENSPQFHLPNVETPLLIMHNDNDGAVPWYQGIELFTGLKRLGKEAWLLNYNGEEHNLMQNANRMDLSIRMRQFFDHYLLGKEAPLWLVEGIPATLKGKELRY